MKNQALLPFAVAAVALGINACNQPAGSETRPATPAAKEQNARVAGSETTPAPAPQAAPAAKASVSSSNVLIFRNVRSWRRKVDFEEALTELGFKFDVKPSAEMAAADLSPYAFVIIPGAQWRDDYYHQYADNAERFDRYVTNGGTLVLELNGAERDGITLPGGARMVGHGATDNALALPTHPILNPLSGKPIHANYASHGYLDAVPGNALILATEMDANQPLPDKPTFIEYPHGAGRVIAACQCFHDQDGSGRGILMETTISYAAEKQWFSPKK
jgi:hypothetical protein